MPNIIAEFVCYKSSTRYVLTMGMGMDGGLEQGIEYHDFAVYFGSLIHDADYISRHETKASQQRAAELFGREYGLQPQHSRR